MMHAYLVLAHRPVAELAPLLGLLDDERNDIYVHLDTRVGPVAVSDVQRLAPRSRVRLVPRGRVVWAHSSQIDAEMRLFRAAAAATDRTYTHVHLISGQDLPLRTQDELHDYFGQHPDVNFVGFAHDPHEDVPPGIRLRVDRYWLLQRAVDRKRRAPLGRAQKVLVGVQHRFGISRSTGRHFQGMHLAKGSNWVSLTSAGVRELVRNEAWIRTISRFTLAVDEIYKQTILWNSDLHSTLSVTRLPDLRSGNRRLIDWSRGRPYTWRMADLDELAASDEMFARKFDPQVDGEIAAAVVAHVLSRAEHSHPSAEATHLDTEEHH